VPAQTPAELQRRDAWPFWTVIAGSAVLVLISAAVVVGADTMWLVALGNLFARAGSVPAGVPFAAADSSHWANLPVLGELLFAGVNHVGPLGLPVAQLLVDAALIALIVMGARALQAHDGATAAVLLIVALGTLPALGVVRAQLLSLLPFAMLMLLLRAEHARPTARVWLVVPLIAVWGNLHGAVLVGVAITGAYLLLSRLRHDAIVSAGVLAASIGALWLNPVGLRTTSYYSGVLTNEAARRGTGLWAPLGSGGLFDGLLIAAGLVLITLTVLSRRPAWEYAVLAGLTVGTITAARHGVWLLLFCAPAAAAGLSRRRQRARDRDDSRARQLVSVGFAVALLLGAGVLLSSRRAALSANENDAVVIRDIAAGRVVLAPEPLVETLAAAGVRVWLSNPIDAFSREDQAAYLDFLEGGGPAAEHALSAADVVVVNPGSASARLAARSGFGLVNRVGAFYVLKRG
jgi:hypothetical protein